MTLSAAESASRRRSGWFANRPLAVKILATIAFSASVGVVLLVVAVSRIHAQSASEQDLYDNHVVAVTDLDSIQETYEAIRQGYTAYFLATPAQREQLTPQ